jgi:hypothetical protein
MSENQKIAWTVACGLCCAFGIERWYHSYFVPDRVEVPLEWIARGQMAAAVSLDGLFAVIVQPERPSRYNGGTYVYRVPRRRGRVMLPVNVDRGYLGFKSIRAPGEWGVQVPWWLVTATFGFCATLPWIEWHRRFRLRALLMLMTLVAVVSGIIAVAGRQ